MSFLTFHIAIFLSATDSELMTADSCTPGVGVERRFYVDGKLIESQRVSENLVESIVRHTQKTGGETLPH